MSLDLGAYAPPAAAEALRGLCGGTVHLPGDPGYDAAGAPWNTAVERRPAAVAYPADTAEVAAIVRAAVQAGLHVAAQTTGHNAGPLAESALADVVLLRTAAMRGVVVDAAARLVTVDAGAVWEDVVRAVAPEGLTALHGSSPDVGVVGYSLGGGMGWYARKLGLQTNSITGAEVVTADGSVVWADAEHHSERFWALRGGGGNFGVVTRLQFRAYDFNTTYGGMLVWDAREAEPVVRRWIDWAAGAPDEVTTACRVLNLPAIPAIPEPFRGRSIAVIDGAVLADDERAEQILAPLRELRPELDTFTRVPTPALIRLHMDPEGPTPGVGGTAVLGRLPQEAAEAFVAASGPGSGSTLLTAELRMLGGALGRPAAGAGAVPSIEGDFLLFCAAVAATPEMAAAGRRDAARLVAAMAPWANGRQYLNFAESAIDASAGYGADAWARLTALRAGSTRTASSAPTTSSRTRTGAEHP